MKYQVLPTQERMSKGDVKQAGELLRVSKQDELEQYLHYLVRHHVLTSERAQILGWYGQLQEASDIRGQKLSQSKYGEYRGDETPEYEPTNADHFTALMIEMQSMGFDTRRRYAMMFEAIGCYNKQIEQLPRLLQRLTGRLHTFPSVLTELNQACDYLLQFRKKRLDMFK